MKSKKILHIDANNFFVGCELLMNPQLRGKPVCVLSNNDGCVVSRSYEAKAIGIPMGIPYFMAKQKFNGVTYLSANFSLYHEISTRIMDLLHNYSYKVDVYSIDEAFIDITGLDVLYNTTYFNICKVIKNDIETRIGVKVSLGLSETKILAKLATHKAKKGNGIHIIERNSIKEELKNINIEEIWGIGKNLSRKFKSFGIFYADEIEKKEDNFYKFNFGKKGLELKYELMGISVIPLTGIAEKPKSIQRTRAFPSFSKDKNYIKTELTLHLHNMCKKLREYNLETTCISVMLRTKDFKVFYLDEKLEFSTSSELILEKAVNKLFQIMFNKEIIYRSCGVCGFCLKDKEAEQLELFKNEKKEKGDKISNIIDKLENKYGKGIIMAGDAGIKTVQENHKRQIRLTST